VSIINEALKKTQQTRKLEKDKRDQLKARLASDTINVHAAQRSSVKTPRVDLSVSIKEKMTAILHQLDFMFNWKTLSLLTTSLLLMLVVGFVAYQHPKEANMPSLNMASLPAKKEMIAFSYVAASGGTKMAFVNKQFYGVGDTLNGMRIVSIGEDTMNVEHNGQVFQLRAGATYLI
jgi:hypothetical protein